MAGGAVFLLRGEPIGKLLRRIEPRDGTECRLRLGRREAIGLSFFFAQRGIGVEMAKVDVAQLVFQRPLLLGFRQQGVYIDVEGAVIIGEGGGANRAVGEWDAADEIFVSHGQRPASRAENPPRREPLRGRRLPWFSINCASPDFFPEFPDSA